METFSMNVIAQSLSPHVEMIAPGVMGINFMKPEKPINTMSEVYKLVQEEEHNKVKSPTPPPGTMSPVFRPSKIPPAVPAKPKASPVSASVPFPTLKAPKTPPPSAVADVPQHGPCTDCGRMIIGPFVSLNDRSLHEECFKCSTCGSSLKNIGYHNINNKLYCEMHAKLAANVIASSSAPPSSFAPAAPSVPAAPVAKPVQAPTPKPAPAPTPMIPMLPATVPTLPSSSIGPPVPTPYGNLGNLPHSPSSSGGLAFRSISPQPFKRISGDFHKVTAPTSPTPGSQPSMPLAYSSGPLPFEMKPYMPPDQSSSSLFSSTSETSQISEVSKSTHTQVVQRTTQVTQQVSQQSSQSQQFAVDYKILTGQQKTKFVWPPPKSEFEIEGSSTVSSTTSSTTQNYSPLATQSTPSNISLPQKSEAPPSFRSVQPPVSAQGQQSVVPPPIPTPPSTFSVPPLPTTFSAEPVKVEETSAPEPVAPAPAEPVKEEALYKLAPLPSGPQPQNFAPVLPPIIDLKAQSTTPAQPGVPTGAGSKPAPKKGKGQLKEQAPGCRIPICADCGDPIRGPFIIALSRTWCPNHFHCNNLHCKTALIDIGFVEEQGQLYCENCYEAFLAPVCNKCNVRIKGDCLNALDKQWHPDCFICAYCHKPFGNNSFYLEDGLPYCEKDWNELFTTKCVGCGFPIEAGDRWVEALNNNYHSQCFKCSICNKNLEGQSFYAKGGRPFCKAHAR